MFHAPSLPLDPNAPYMPSQVHEAVTKVDGPFPDKADTYTVDPPFYSDTGVANTIQVAKGTPKDQVVKEVNITASSKLFIHATTDPGDFSTKADVVGAATLWWSLHVRPLFPLH